MAADSSFPSTFHDAILHLFAVVSSVFFVIFIVHSIRPTKTLPLPPGPRPLPIIGNLFDIPKDLSSRKYHDMSNKYGDIMHLHAFGRRIIVLGSLEAVTDLLDKRSANYSGRPYSTMAELIKVHELMAAATNGPVWQKQRRAFHRFFSRSASTQWHALQEGGIKKLLSLLLEDPEHFSEHVEFAFGSTSMQVAYGISPKNHHDEFLALFKEAGVIFAQTSIPGKYLVESFPILRYIPSWFPGARFQREAARWRRIWSVIRNKAFDDTIARTSGGWFDHSIVAAMVQEAEAKGTFLHENDSVMRDVSASVYLGGVDTTQMITRVFLLAMVLHPEAQVRAQAQLDTVIGTNRLPSLSDRDSLPYIEALVMECHRWNPILPFSIPHTCTDEEDGYNGYRIPKGSLVIANTWAFAHDPRNYADPERFMPERYLTREGRLNRAVLDPRTFTFGYGRRICPGRHFGDASVWIAAVSILHVFDIRPPLDEKGEAVALTAKFTEGLLAPPEPFQCRITSRSSTAEALIRQDPA